MLRQVPILLLYPIAFALTAGLLPITAALARRFGWMDRPGGLKKHGEPIPYGGGAAIILGFAATVFLATGGELAPTYRAIFLASIVVFLGGAWDDLHPMGAWKKLAVQSTAAAILVWFEVHLKMRVLPDWLNIALTFVWIIGITNAMNLVDIMDGLCGSVSGAAALAFGLIGLLTGNPPLALFGVALSAATSAFLLHNFSPARLYMGDAGAQFIGFVLAAVSVQASYTTFNNIALFAPILILGVPIYDTALVTVLRLRKGKSPLAGSPDHLALRLRRLGLSVPATVRACMLLTAALSIAAVAAIEVRLEAAVAIYAVSIVVAAVVGILVGRVRMES